MSAFRLGSPFGSHMVLQRDMRLPIWGRDDAGQSVTIRVNDQAWSGVTDRSGRWEIEVGPFQVGDPLRIQINGSQQQVLEDVLVGEVWLASGQSNMEWPLIAAAGAEEEVPRADFPAIRLLTIPKTTAETPNDFVDNDGWQVCTPQSAAPFSAVGYFFARELHVKLGGIPIGVICNAWGGAAMEAYTPLPVLAADPSLQWAVHLHSECVSLRRSAPEGTPEEQLPIINHIPALLYNAMLHPIAPLRIRGVIWYQGESNVARADQYTHLSERMITAWRTALRDEDLPFLYVQLAGFRAGWPGWSELVDAQRRTLQVPNTAMATAIDIGEAEDIHPRNKLEVGLRLARAARALAYGEQITPCGPLVQQATREGSRVLVTFENAIGGLVARRGNESVAGFELAGEDGIFHPAVALIEGESLIVSSDAVSVPRQVRYAWSDFPDCDLANREDLPASPFRVEVSNSIPQQ
jgi:sialate O-acetylesterase